MHKVLVADFSNWDTLMEIPFVFKDAGFIVHTFCSKDSWLLKNSFCDKWIVSPEEETAFAQALINEATSKENYNWILIGDEKLLDIMNHYIKEEDLFYKIMPLTKIENRKIFASKRGLSELCVQYGINTPKFFIWDKDKKLNIEELDINFPVLLKQDLSWGGNGISKCENREELKSEISRHKNEYDIVIQEFVKGIDIGVEAFFYKGELVEYAAGVINSYFSSAFDFTTRRTYAVNTEIESLLRTLGQKIGINGFGSIQYIYHETFKEYYLLEVDIRPNIWVPYGKFSGHDFSAAIRKIINGTIKFPIVFKEAEATEVAVFYRDIIKCCKQKTILGILKWLINYKGCWKFIPTYDKNLFKNILYELFIRKVSKKMSSIFK